MAMNRTDKTAEVAALAEKFSSAEILLLTHNKGLNSAATTELRVKAREIGVDYRVAKNTLAKLALKGTQYEDLSDKLQGPTGFVTGTDGVATAKVIVEFAKKNPKLEIVGAKFGDMMMDASEVDAFSKLPTLDEIRSKLVGLLQAPASQIVGVTDAYGKKEGGEAPAAASAEAPAETASAEPEAAPAE